MSISTPMTTTMLSPTSAPAPATVQFPKTRPLSGTEETATTATTTTTNRHRSTRSEASATLTNAHSISEHGHGHSLSLSLPRPYAHSEGARSGRGRGRTHARLDAQLQTRSVSRSRSPSRSRSRDLRSTSSLSVELDTAYHGPVIPPNADRSCFLPPTLPSSLARGPGAHPPKSAAAAAAAGAGNAHSQAPGRTLVLCFDGTGNQFDLTNSNVVNFFSVLRKGDHTRQLVYYQSGIGTYSVPSNDGSAKPRGKLGEKASRLVDEMVANSLGHHVMSGYKFLMQEYTPTSKICIFGFSRGAYTARALAGMVHKVGLLPRGNAQQLPFAYAMFANDSEEGWRQSVGFKRCFSLDVDVDFVGVWETVASVGLFPSTLPFTRSNTAIKVFRHALALDERRVKFRPSPYQRVLGPINATADFQRPENEEVEEKARVGAEVRRAVKVWKRENRNGVDAAKGREAGRDGRERKVQGTLTFQPGTAPPTAEKSKKTKDADTRRKAMAKSAPAAMLTAPDTSASASAADVQRSVSSSSAPAPRSTPAPASTTSDSPKHTDPVESPESLTPTPTRPPGPAPLTSLRHSLARARSSASAELVRVGKRLSSDVSSVRRSADRLSGELERSRERFEKKLNVDVNLRRGLSFVSGAGGSEEGDGEDEEAELSPDAEKDRLEAMYLDRSRPTDVKEVWFAGSHGDVGGGCVPNDTPASLARLSLRWMVRECFRARTGIQFEANRLRALGLEPATLWPVVLESGQEGTAAGHVHHQHHNDHDEKRTQSGQHLESAHEKHANASPPATKKSNSTSTSSSPRAPSPLRSSLRRANTTEEGEDESPPPPPTAPEALAPKMGRRAASFSLDGTLVEGEGREGREASVVHAEAEADVMTGSSKAIGMKEAEERHGVGNVQEPETDIDTDAETDTCPSVLKPPRVSVEAASSEALDELVFSDPTAQVAEVESKTEGDDAKTTATQTSTDVHVCGDLDEKHSPAPAPAPASVDAKRASTSSDDHDNEKKPAQAHVRIEPFDSEKPATSSHPDATAAAADAAHTAIPAPSALEAVANIEDARAPLFDQLRLARWWWILELVPIRERVQREDGTWKKKWTLNRGRPRPLPAQYATGAEPLRVHRSVHARMQDKELKYTPSVKFGNAKVVWVD